mmetsp:Transcript_113916/g.362241  ORF Transcript_113916/g.362241 Transcript_113916/m.362241 type:complete len:266 (+) Transcript_113916:432-1229(+)
MPSKVFFLGGAGNGAGLAAASAAERSLSRACVAQLLDAAPPLPPKVGNSAAAGGAAFAFAGAGACTGALAGTGGCAAREAVQDAAGAGAAPPPPEPKDGKSLPEGTGGGPALAFFGCACGAGWLALAPEGLAAALAPQEADAGPELGAAAGPAGPRLGKCWSSSSSSQPVACLCCAVRTFGGGAWRGRPHPAPGPSTAVPPRDGKSAALVGSACLDPQFDEVGSGPAEGPPPRAPPNIGNRSASSTASIMPFLLRSARLRVQRST